MSVSGIKKIPRKRWHTSANVGWHISSVIRLKNSVFEPFGQFLQYETRVRHYVLLTDPAIDGNNMPDFSERHFIVRNAAYVLLSKALLKSTTKKIVSWITFF